MCCEDHGISALACIHKATLPSKGCGRAETSSQPLHAPRTHCWMQRLAGVITDNPARVFAVLAGVAFVVLLATLIAQIAVALVCEVRRSSQ